MDLDCVLHVQQRIFQGDEGSAPSGLIPSSCTTTSALRSLLFTPIAGDGTLNISSTVPDAELNGLRFGMLDAATVVKLSVALITNPACVEHPGCLSDLPTDRWAPNGRWIGGWAPVPSPTDPARRATPPITPGAPPAGGAPARNCPGHFGRIHLPYPVINPLFVGLLVAVLQTVCVHCQRLRLSPYYINATLPPLGRNRVLQRLKLVTAMCSRQQRCQFCGAELLQFTHPGGDRQWPSRWQQTAGTHHRGAPRAHRTHGVDVRLGDLLDPHPHPGHGPGGPGVRRRGESPVQRHPRQSAGPPPREPTVHAHAQPEVRSALHRGGQDGRWWYTRRARGCITMDYQTILNSAGIIRTGQERNAIWTRYTEMHMAIERIILNQRPRLCVRALRSTKTRGTVSSPPTTGASTSGTPCRATDGAGAPRPPCTPSPSAAGGWANRAASDGARRPLPGRAPGAEGMGKRVNFCATRRHPCLPVTPDPALRRHLRQPSVLERDHDSAQHRPSDHRPCGDPRLQPGTAHVGNGVVPTPFPPWISCRTVRSCSCSVEATDSGCDPSTTSPFDRLSPVAHGDRRPQNLVLRPGDCILRRHNKYRITANGVPPPVMPEDVPLPVQSTPDPASGVVSVQLCFVRGVRSPRTHPRDR